MQCAPAACVPCSQKKRKCDRLLPACSRCSSVRTHGLCWYKDSSRPISAFMPVVAWQPPKAEMACGPCRSQKRACNRVLPSCSRCKLQSRTCAYDTTSTSERTAKSPDQISIESPTAKAPLRTLYGPEIRIAYPARNSKYIPGLIHHFCSVLIVPATAALPNSLAKHIQANWMLSALGDPCLFHATLFSASAHMDGLFGIPNNPRTIHHQLQAVRLLRERLTQPGFRANYETIGAVLGLGFFDIVIKNVHGVQAHNQGLIQMLAMTHDQGPETEALIGLANMTHFTLSMVSHTDALFLPRSTTSRDSNIHPVHPLSGIPSSSLLSRVLARVAAHSDNLAPVFSPATVLDLISTVRVVAQQDAESPLWEFLTDTAAATKQTPGAEALRGTFPFVSFWNPSPMAQAMNECVQLAAEICRNLLLQRTALAGPSTQPSPTTSTSRAATTITSTIKTTMRASITTRSSRLHKEISCLKATLPKIDSISWLQHAPEVYVWVCFTAAAAAYCKDKERIGECDNDDWTSFILTPMPVITAIDSAELRLLREGWAYLRWMRGKT